MTNSTKRGRGNKKLGPKKIGTKTKPENVRNQIIPRVAGEARHRRPSRKSTEGFLAKYPANLLAGEEAEAEAEAEEVAGAGAEEAIAEASRFAADAVLQPQLSNPSPQLSNPSPSISDALALALELELDSSTKTTRHASTMTIQNEAWITRQDAIYIAQKEWSSACRRLNEIEAHIKKLSKRVNMEFSAPRGSCANKCCHCGKSTHIKKNGDIVSLSIPWVPFEILKTDKTIKYKDFREVRQMLNAYAYCTECKDKISENHSIAPKRWFQKDQVSKQCAICRERKANNAKLTCSTCNIDGLQKEHATNKKVFTCLLKSIVDVTYDVTCIDIHEEYSTHETLAIDCVAIVTTKDGKKLLFAFEIQATKKEKFDIFSHKMLNAVKKVKPYRSFFVNFNLNVRAATYSIAERLEILRRWVMFGILHAKRLPTLNYWECFWERSSPFADDKSSDCKHEFLTKALRIEQAPAGLKSDWEFMVDPFSFSYNGDTKTNQQHPYKDINKNLLQTEQYIFGNSYKVDLKKCCDTGVFRPDKRFNIDKCVKTGSNTPSWQHYRCKMNGCDECKNILKECEKRED